MKISSTFATFVAAVFLVLTYFEYVPMYISVTITICAFINYLSTSIVSAIVTLQEAVNEEQIKIIDCIQKPAESITNKLDALVQVTKDIKLQNDSLITKIENCSKNIENVINEDSKQSNGILSEIKSQTDSNFQGIKEICDSLKESLSNTTIEICKFNDSVIQNKKDTRDTINDLMSVTEKKSCKFGEAVDSTIHDFNENIKIIDSNLSALGDSINTYTSISNSLIESNVKTYSVFLELVNKINESSSNISRKNRQYIDDLKELTSNNIEELKKTLKDNISEQTDSLTENVDELQGTINKLSSELSMNLKKLEIDVDAICTSVDDMKQMSQNVETTDKELLAKILKFKKK